MKKILDDGAEPLMLLGLIAHNFHRLFLSKELMKQGVERKEVARIMKLPYSKQEDFLATARRADAEKTFTHYAKNRRNRFGNQNFKSDAALAN